MRKFKLRILIDSADTNGPAVSSEVCVGIVQADSIDSLVKTAHGLGQHFGKAKDAVAEHARLTRAEGGQLVIDELKDDGSVYRTERTGIPASE